MALALLSRADPLGLGRPRAAAPADPDVYDPEREAAEYSRSLLSAEERADITLLTIAEVRNIIAENTSKGSVEAGGLDPEVIAMVDARINFKIFIAGDNIYTREELYNHYPFQEFGVDPESVFCQQEIGVFGASTSASTSASIEYVTRDVGACDPIGFVLVGDLVAAATQRGPPRAPRAPTRIVKTKVYVGKERWDDFALLQRVFRGANRVQQACIANGTQNNFCQLALAADQVQQSEQALAQVQAEQALAKVQAEQTQQAVLALQTQQAQQAQQTQQAQQAQQTQQAQLAQQALQAQIDALTANLEAFKIRVRSNISC